MKRRGWVVLSWAIIACNSERGPQFAEITVPMVAGTTQSADPAITVDASGALLMTWVAGDSSNHHLYFARSTDRGSSWSAPVRVTDREHDIVPHAEASPQLVTAGNTLAVFWPNHIVVPGRRFPASHLRFSRSTDGGATWSAAITLNDDTTGALAGHTFHGAAARGDSLVVAWLDSRVGAELHAEGDTAVHHDGDATIYTATSGDRGATWSQSNTRLWGDACPCCRVSLSDAGGKLMAAWRGHFPGHVRDPVIASVSPPGPPIRVSVDGWVLEGCPHSGPAIAAANDGQAHVAWFTGKTGEAGVFYAHQQADTFTKAVPIITGQTLPAAHPALVVSAGVPVIAMNLADDGSRSLTLAMIANDRVIRTVVPGTDGSDHPHLAATIDGAVVAWTEKKGSTSRVRAGTIKLR